MIERMYAFFGEDEPFFIERSEAERITRLLAEIPTLTDWTPLANVAKRIGQRSDQTANSARLLAGAKRIEIEHAYGNETIAAAPILKIKKDRYNKRKNATGKHFMRAPIYIKKP